MPLALPVSEPVARAIEEVTRSVKEKYGGRLQRVILFGSAARGTMGPESDVDLLVVVDADEWAAMRELSEITFPHLLREDLIVSAISIHPERWAEMKRRGKSFAKTVEREGIVLA